MIHKQDHELRDFVSEIARDAGAQLHEFFRKPDLRIEEKGVGDIVTEADKTVEAFLIEKIHARFPNEAVLAEESGKSVDINESDWVWVIDPLDGTHNFSKGVPIFGTMICRAMNPFCDQRATAGKRCRTTVDIAAVYMPMTDRLSIAQRGFGTWVNDERVEATHDFHTRVLEQVGDSDPRLRISLSSHFDDDSRKWILPLRAALEEKGFEIVRYHSAAGAIDALLQGEVVAHIMNDQNPWDFAPIQLLALEAGFTAHRVGGEYIKWWDPAGGYILSAPSYYHQLQDLIE